MQNQKIYLAVSITGNRVGDLGALSSARFAGELLMEKDKTVKVRCIQNFDQLIADCERFCPYLVCVVEGMEGKVDLEVYHQVVNHWEQYAQSYQMASDVIFHSIRLRKMHNRHVQAGYMMQWLQRIEAPAVYVRIGIPEMNINEMLAQGRALALALST